MTVRRRRLVRVRPSVRLGLVLVPIAVLVYLLLYGVPEFLQGPSPERTACRYMRRLLAGEVERAGYLVLRDAPAELRERSGSQVVADLSAATGGWRTDRIVAEITELTGVEVAPELKPYAFDIAWDGVRYHDVALVHLTVFVWYTQVQPPHLPQAIGYRVTCTLRDGDFVVVPQ